MPEGMWDVFVTKNFQARALGLNGMSANHRLRLVLLGVGE
jgi:hypothetical protein